ARGGPASTTGKATSRKGRSERRRREPRSDSDQPPSWPGRVPPCRPKPAVWVAVLMQTRGHGPPARRSAAPRRTPSRSSAPEPVPMRAGELRHDLLQVEAEIVARPVDRQMLGLRHGATLKGGAKAPPSGSKGQNVKAPTD